MTTESELTSVFLKTAAEMLQKTIPDAQAFLVQFCALHGAVTHELTMTRARSVQRLMTPVQTIGSEAPQKGFSESAALELTKWMDAEFSKTFDAIRAAATQVGGRSGD
ncbi:MAG: hypothetical protein EOM24_33445 [Chloroflexia bacterium]|nr:hypothetical protein [Chloroflexia bacterium]